MVETDHPKTGKVGGQDYYKAWSSVVSALYKADPYWSSDVHKTPIDQAVAWIERAGKAGAKSKYDEVQTNTAEKGLDYVADAFRKLGVLRDKVNKAALGDPNDICCDLDEIRDQLETWLHDRDYVASIP